jgi:hypothetical protein
VAVTLSRVLLASREGAVRPGHAQEKAPGRGRARGWSVHHVSEFQHPVDARLADAERLCDGGLLFK